MINWRDRMTINIPEGELDGARVETFTVEEFSWANLRLALSGRDTAPGTYTKLVVDGQLWMSDTDAEKSDHTKAVAFIETLRAERVLINGLGLGMVLAAALSFDHVKHVDVVEIDRRVIELVGPTYLTDTRVAIHHADAYEQAKSWPPGTRWDVGWSDIWGTVNTDDLALMAKMNRSYGRRCTWHGCWAQDSLRQIRHREQSA